MSDVSIVTTTFGDQEAAIRVGTGLEAVQRTGGDPPAEVIVVAVGRAGREAAEKLVENTEGTSLRPEIIDLDEGTGYARAANTGAAKTTGDIVVVARPEVTFHQRFLHRLRIEASEKWDFLAPAVREGEDGKIATGVMKRGRSHRLVPVESPPARTPTKVTAGNGACVIVRRHVLERRVAAVGGLFEEAYESGGDLDLWWWAERHGLAVRYVPNLFVGNSVGQERIETAPERRRTMANYRVTVWKHAESRDLTGWVLGEAAFISEEIGGGGVSGLKRYLGSWRDSVRAAQAIKAKRGSLRT